MNPSSFRALSYLMIEANSSCNLRCVGCTREFLEEQGMRERKNITEEEFESILEQVKDCPLRVIKFEGLSEPMLHPKFDQLSRKLRAYFPLAEIIVFSNLQYDAVKTPLLQTLPHISFLHLSVDGVGSTYEKMRPPARYDRLLESLLYLKKNVPAEVRRNKVYFNFTAFEENFKELPDVYALCADFDCAGVRINVAQNWNEELQSKLPSTEMQEFLKGYRKDLRGVGGWQYKDCFWPFRGVAIDVFGNVRQCVLNTTQEPLGNLFQRSLQEIFEQSPLLQKARSQLRANQPGPGCNTCDYHLLSDTIQNIHGRPYFHKPFQ